MVQQVGGDTYPSVEWRNSHVADVKYSCSFFERKHSDYLLLKSDKVPSLPEEIDFREHDIRNNCEHKQRIAFNRETFSVVSFSEIEEIEQIEKEMLTPRHRFKLKI